MYQGKGHSTKLNFSGVFLRCVFGRLLFTNFHAKFEAILHKWRFVERACIARVRTCTLFFVDRWAAYFGNEELAVALLEDKKCEVNYIDKETGENSQ